MTTSAGSIGKRLIIHAPNVHTGGGAVLLSAVLASDHDFSTLVLLADARMMLDPALGANVTVHCFAPTIAARFSAERKLAEIAGPEDVVLAFGNLPPLFRLKAETVLFVQNRYIVDPAMPIGGFGPSARVRLMVERLWVKWRIVNADRVIVQTSTMAQLFEQAFGRQAQVSTFHPGQTSAAAPGVRQSETEKIYDYIYVSSGEPHKNHSNLLDAWALLAEAGVRPSLALTLSPQHEATLVARVAELNQRNHTRITNLGRVSSAEALDAYASAGMLIFPSRGESFGLPLIEASERGLPIIASELDYVRDVVVPVETFDPHSPRSIANAVRRSLGLPPALHTRVGAADFLEQVHEGRP